MTSGFWWILFSLLIYGVFHSLLASRRFKAMLYHRFGPRSTRWHRFLFSLMGGLTILPVLALVALLPDRVIYSVSMPFAAVMNLLRLAGLIGLVYGVLQTGFMNFIGLDRVLDPAAGDKPPRFVTNGLYRWVRHPLYTCAMLLMWAAPNLSWNTLAFNLGVSVYLIIGSRYEEQKLLNEYGSAYQEYRQRTPAFLPRLWRKRG